MITTVYQYTRQLASVEGHISELILNGPVMPVYNARSLEPKFTEEQQKRLDELLSLRMQLLNEIARNLGYKLVKEDEYRY